MRILTIIIIVTIVLSAITYAGGGIVVTQGNCCGGGGGSVPYESYAFNGVNGEKYINYITLTVAAIAQIQAQQVQIDKLMARVNKIEKK